MGKVYIPSGHEIARLARGWPSSPNVKPQIPVEIDRAHTLGDVWASALWSTYTKGRLYTRDGRNSTAPALVFNGNFVSRATASTEYSSITNFPSDEFTIICRGDSATDNDYTIEFGTYDPGLRFRNTAQAIVYWDGDKLFGLLPANFPGIVTYVLRGTYSSPTTTLELWIDGTKGGATPTVGESVNGKSVQFLGGFTRTNSAEFEFMHLFDRALTDAEIQDFWGNQYSLYRPANQSPFSIGTAAAGGPDYSETLSSSVTASASFVETYGAPAYSEVLASSVTSSANLVEAYQAPGYSETIASAVTSSANLVEAYGAPNYSEVIASAVTSSASLVEAYELGQNYQETITASVTSSATLAEAYQAPAYNETITVSVTSSANLVETWEVAYTEVLASAVTSSATLAETYESGLSYAETISASVTSSANLVETYGAPSYSEVLASAVTSSATFTEAFTTPQALPTIVELSAITLPGYSAKSLRID